MQSILSYLNGETVTNIDEINLELESELNRNAAKAQANRDKYELVRDLVLGALGSTPVTIAELYEEIKGDLPEDFTKSKVQYGVTHYWNDQIVKHEGKTSTYTLA